MSEAERKASMDEFFAYHEMLRQKNHIVGGEGLQDAKNAATLRFRNGAVSVTDGPYAETKEQLAGYFILEARDLNQAIDLMSKHPVVKGGPIEIRALADPDAMTRAREQWRSSSDPARRD